MRIIAGLYKGRKLMPPPDRSVRPTPDRVKEAMFSILDEIVYDSVVLDLFAGSGALGLEALSRGAKKCFFGDNSKESVRIIRQNIFHCNAELQSSIMDLPKWLLLPIAGIIVFLTIRSDFLKGQSIKIEARFVANFNEKLLHHLMEKRKVIDDEHWLGDQVSVVEFTVSKTGKYRIINDLYDSRVLNLLTIKIIRQGKHILMPDLKQPLKDGDIIHVLGSKSHLDAYLFHLKSEDHLNLYNEHRSTLKEYTYGQVFKNVEPKDQIICSAIQMQKDSAFSKKSIKNSGFRRRYQGSIIAIERGPLPIIAPRVNTIIEPGDVLWVVGTESMARKLLIDGLLKG